MTITGLYADASLHMCKVESDNKASMLSFSFIVLPQAAESNWPRLSLLGASHLRRSPVHAAKQIGLKPQSRPSGFQPGSGLLTIKRRMLSETIMRAHCQEPVMPQHALRLPKISCTFQRLAPERSVLYSAVYETSGMPDACKPEFLSMSDHTSPYINYHLEMHQMLADSHPG